MFSIFCVFSQLLYLAKCNASDPFQQWEGATLSAAASAATGKGKPSTIKNVGTATCLATLIGVETSFLRCHFILKQNVTQDRLGTDVGTVEKEHDVPPAGDPTHAGTCAEADGAALFLYNASNATVSVARGSAGAAGHGVPGACLVRAFDCS